MKAHLFAIIASLSLVIPAQTDARVTDNTYTNPVIKSSSPDPSVIRAQDGYFYLYATENTRNVPIYKSKDLVNWKFIGTAFNETSRPTTVSPYVSWKNPQGKNVGAKIWAPDINYINGKYVLYYAIGVWGILDKSGIGVATADSPEGPFTDHGALFISEDIGVTNSIDQFFIQDGGKNYLIWGSFRGIYIVQLTDDGLRVMPGVSKQKISGNFMEASYVYKSKDGYYYLFGSDGSCCEGAKSTYRVVYGRSKSLFGPYTTKDGGKMLDNKRDVLLAGNDVVAGPGHNAEFVTDDNGDTWIIYHGYLKENPSQGRVVFLDQVKWKDGWPYVEGGVPSSTATSPYFK